MSALPDNFERLPKDEKLDMLLQINAELIADRDSLKAKVEAPDERKEETDDNAKVLRMLAQAMESLASQGTRDEGQLLKQAKILKDSLVEVHEGRERHLRSYEHAEASSQKQLDVYERDEATRMGAEIEAYEKVIKHCLRTAEGVPVMDPSLALNIYYLSSSASQAERTQYLVALCRGATGKLQLQHQAKMLKLMQEDERNELLELTDGRVMTAPMPLLPTLDSMTSTMANKIKSVNREIADMAVAVTGGEVANRLIISAANAPGFQFHKPVAIGGGQMKHISNPD